MATVGVVKAIITADTTQLKKGMTDAQRSMDRMGKQMSKVGKSMTMKVTMPLVGLGVAAAKMASDFEFSMTQIETLVGRSAKEVETLKGAVLGLSGETGRAPKELADAMFFITSAGLDAVSATAALEASAKAAAVGLGDTVVVADAVTNAMNGYGMAADGAAFATDVLAKTVEQGKASAADLAPQFGRLIPMAAELGISFDQVGGGLAFLTRASGDAAMSATQLGGVMKSILKPSQMAKGVMEDIGINLHDLRAAASEDLLGALQGLRATLEANGLEMSNVFEDIRGLNGALQLTGVATGKAREVFDELADSTGKLDEAFRGVQKTAQFKLSQAMAGMKASMITLGEQVLPVIIPMVAALAGFIGKLATAFGNMSGPAQKVIVIFGIVAAAIGPVLMVLGSLSSALVTLGVTAGGAALGIGALLGPITAVIAVGVGLFALFSKMGAESKKAEERQAELADAFVASGDKSSLLGDKLDGLIERHNALAEATKEVTEETEAFIGESVLMGEAMKNKVGKHMENLSATVENLGPILATGTDEFQRLEQQARLLGTTTDESLIRALRNADPAVRDVTTALAEQFEQGKINRSGLARMLDSLDETADAYDDYSEKLESNAKEILTNADRTAEMAEILGADMVESLIDVAEKGDRWDEILGVLTTQIERTVTAEEEAVTAAEALTTAQAATAAMFADSTAAMDDYRAALETGTERTWADVEARRAAEAAIRMLSAGTRESAAAAEEEAAAVAASTEALLARMELGNRQDAFQWGDLDAAGDIHMAVIAEEELVARLEDEEETRRVLEDQRRRALQLANDMKTAQSGVESATRDVARAAEDVKDAERGVERVLEHQIDLGEDIERVAQERRAVAAEIDAISDRITANLQEQRDLEEEGTEFAASIAQEFRKAALSVLELTDKVEDLRNEAEAVAPDTGAQRALILGMHQQVAAVNEVEEALIDMGIISAEDAGMMDLTVKQAKTLVRLQRELEETTADYEAGEASLLDLMGATQDYDTAMNTARADSRALQQAQEDLNEMMVKGAEIDANREKAQLKLAIAEEELRLATQMGTEETFKQNRILEEQAKLEVDRLRLLDEKAEASERDHQLDIKSWDLKSQLSAQEYHLQAAHDAVTAAKEAQAVADEELHYSEARLAEVMGRVNAAAKDGTGLFGDLQDIIHAVTGEFRSLIELMEKPIRTPSPTSGGGGGGGAVAAPTGLAPTGAGHGWTPPTEWMMNVVQKGGADLWSQISGAASTDASNVAARFNALNEALQAGHTPGAVEEMLSMFDSAHSGGTVARGGLVNVAAGEVISPASGGGITVVVNIEGSVSSERDLVESIRKGLLQAQKSGRSVVLN
jgi:TP901 family phage tail tape measure protein